MSIVLRSTWPDGTDSRLLNQVGQVAGWKHTSTFPGGPTTASFDFYTDPQLDNPAVKQGRLIYAYAGAALVWSGVLGSPQRGTPWSCTATGLAGLPKNFVAGTSLTLNTVVDAAIANTLPWTRPASLTSPTTPTSGQPTLSVESTLDATLGLLLTQGGYWYVNPTGVVSTQTAPPTAINYLVFANDWPGQTAQNFATVVVGEYTSGGVQTVTVTAGSAAIARQGYVAYAFDTGSTSLSAATAAANAQLALLNQPTWNGPFTLMRGQITAPGGGLVDPAACQPNTVMRVCALQTGDSYGVVNVDLPVGQVDYDDDAGTVALTPLSVAGDDLTTLFASAFSN